jgi:hypothetical protein
LAVFGVTQYPQLTIQIIYVFLQFMSFVTVGIAVFLNYYFMPRRSLFVAILFTLPLFFITSRPFWDYKTQYYVIHLFSYSLIPVRMFTVVGVGSLCIWLLRNANNTISRILLYGFCCGIITSIGIYQSNDFGLFAAIGVGAAIVFQPFQTWQKRIGLATIFVVSTIIGSVGLLVLNTDWPTLNTSYLFWFQRTFASGFGALPIQFPGNGLMIIISIITLWFCTLNVYLILLKHASTYAKDHLISSHFALLMFMITTTVLTISYYINRSAISFQGSSMYIGLGISVFLLYQLIMRMTMHQPQQSFLSYSNIAFQLLVLFPVAIALVYTPLYSRLDHNSMNINQIITKNTSDITNTPEYKALHIKQVQNIYTALQPLKMKVAFAGAFANLVELYTNIPSVNAFDHLRNMNTSELNIYCNQINQMPYDIIFVDSIQKTHLCNNMMVLISQKIAGKIYLHRDFTTKYPQQWHQMNEILCPNAGFRWNSTLSDDIRFCESK